MQDLAAPWFCWVQLGEWEGSRAEWRSRSMVPAMAQSRGLLVKIPSEAGGRCLRLRLGGTPGSRAEPQPWDPRGSLPCRPGCSPQHSLSWTSSTARRDGTIRTPLAPAPHSPRQKVLSGPRAELNLPGPAAPSPRGQPASPQRTYRVTRNKEACHGDLENPSCCPGFGITQS